MTERMKHKAIKRKLMAWLLLVCVLFSGCGIDLRNYIYTEASLKRVAAKSLKEKYGEEFVIYRAWDRSQEMFFVECSPKDDPEVVFKADICKNGDGVVVDGYTQGVIAKELDEILRDDFENMFEGCYTKAMPLHYYNVYEFENPKEVTLKEYISQVEVDSIRYDVFILRKNVSSESISKEYEVFSKVIPEKILDGVIPQIVVVLHFVDEEMLQQCKEYHETRTTTYGTFKSELIKFPEIGFAYPDDYINISYEEYEEMRMEVNINE